MGQLTFKRLQDEQRAWGEYNFGPLDADCAFLGMMEEMGEMAHALLKQKQKIRGTSEEHEAKAKDAFADIMVFAMNFASAKGWDAQAVIENVWDEVKKRDWKRFPKNGATE